MSDKPLHRQRLDDAASMTEKDFRDARSIPYEKEACQFCSDQGCSYCEQWLAIEEDGDILRTGKDK